MSNTTLSNRVGRFGLWLVIGLVVVAGFHKLARHPADILVGPQRGGYNDLTDSILAQRTYPFGAAVSGGWPTWNPFALAGVPYVGNPQTAWLYPGNWVYALVSPTAAISWMLVLHHVIGAWGAGALARRLGLSHVAALVAGMTYGLAPYLVANTAEGHHNPVCSAAWFPWLWLAYENHLAGRRWAWLWVAFGISICFFCGHPQETFYLVLLMSAGVVLEAVREARGGRAASGVGRLFVWAGIGLLTIGLVAKDLLPIYAYTKEAVRAAGIGAAEAGRGGMPLANLGQIVFPWLWGDAMTYGVPGAPQGLYLWETFAHFGVMAFLLAVLGLSSAGDALPARRMAWVLVVTVLFALGSNGPVYEWIHRLVPGVSYFRAPSRALFLTTLAVSVLAAYGVDRLREPLGRWWRGGLLAFGVPLALGCLAVAVLVMGRLSQPERLGSLGESRAIQRLATSSVDWLVPGLALGTLSLGAMGRGGRRVAMACGTLLVAVEAIVCASQLTAAIDRNSLRTESPLLATLKERAGQHRVMARQVILSDREAWGAGVFKLQGYEPVPTGGTAALFYGASKNKLPLDDMGGFGQLDLRQWNQNVLDLLGVRLCVLQVREPRPELLGWKLIGKGWIPSQFTLRGEEPKGTMPVAIYENPKVLPRAFLLGEVRVVRPDEDALVALQTLDPRGAVLVSSDPLPSGPRQPFTAAKIRAYQPQRVVIEAAPEQPAILVLTDSWFPGWRATVDGQPTDVLRVNLGLRGVALSPGKHEVVFEFVPPGLVTGGLLSMLTAVVIVGLSVWEWRRKVGE
jgi:hypothetical protein